MHLAIRYILIIVILVMCVGEGVTLQRLRFTCLVSHFGKKEIQKVCSVREPTMIKQRVYSRVIHKIK